MVLPPPSAVPHISHEIASGDFMTASPRGEKPCPVSNMVHSVAAGAISLQRLLPRGRSCQKSALRNRFLTDVGDCAAKAAQKISAVQNTPQCVRSMFQFLALRHNPRHRSRCPGCGIPENYCTRSTGICQRTTGFLFISRRVCGKTFSFPLAFDGELR